MKVIYLAIAVLILMAACNRSPKDNNQQTMQTPKTEHQSVAEHDAPLEDAPTSVSANEAAFNGVFVLLPEKYASVTLSIDGNVKSTSLLPGKYVQKGDLLATLENPEFINLQQNYLEAVTQCEYLEAEYKRQEVLSQEEAASLKRFQESKAAYLSMKIRKDADAALLTMLGVSPETLLTDGMKPLLEVYAPISGYIANLQINMGKHIEAGESLCEIIDKSNPLIKLTAYEKDLNRIKIGDKLQFLVNGMGDERFAGEIISIGQRVDNVNRSLEIYTKVIDSHPMFRPGMYVYAHVVRE